MLMKSDDWTGMKKQFMFWGEVTQSSPQAFSYQLKHPGHAQLPPKASALPLRLGRSSSPVWFTALSSSTAAIQVYSRATFPVLDSWKLLFSKRINKKKEIKRKHPISTKQVEK